MDLSKKTFLFRLYPISIRVFTANKGREKIDCKKNDMKNE